MVEKKIISRRDFLKMGSVLGVATAAGGTRLLSLSANEEKTSSPSLIKKNYNSIDEMYQIDPNYQRMDEKNTVFNRAVWDSPIAPPQGVFMSFFAKFQNWVPMPQRGEPGYAPYDHALSLAAWSGHDIGAPLGAVGVRSSGPLTDWNRYTNPTATERYEFSSNDEAARIVKRAASFLGADLVGIAPYDERWTYSKWFDMRPALFENKDPVHEDAILPFKPKTVIAMAFEMDNDALRAFGQLNESATGREYSHMAETGSKVAVFLNFLGYKAIPAGNDTGLSIPIAIQAGLGELARMGTLVTEKYGSRVRLAKVYTDLEMTTDKPKSFGVWDFCKRCRKCADLCPAGAISKADAPTKDPNTGSKSSHPGVTKWYQNNERCFTQWERNGAACGVCLTVCPYNKLDTWNHELAKTLVSVPVGRDIARQLDDLFGYGKADPQNATYFWNEKK